MIALIDSRKNNVLCDIIDEDKIRINIGAIFCHERRISEQAQDREEITEGNQKCSGGSPSFRSILTEIKNKKNVFGNIGELFIRFVVLSRNTLDPKA
jgi:hypothetical protein